jgi:kinesin family member 5
MDSVRVVIRFRGGERGDPEEFAPWVLTDTNVSLTGKEANFAFDAVLGNSHSQADLYERSSKELVSAFMDGFNGTIFAYGQSGSGKTFSMLGPEEVTEVLINQYDNVPQHIQEMFGIIPRCTDQIFSIMNQGIRQGSTFSMSVSYIEVYNEMINDILANPVLNNLKTRESPKDGLIIMGLEPHSISSPEQVYSCLAMGTANRIVCSTGQNARSSRSHTVLIFFIEQKCVDGSVKKSKLNLVDLAGSEKISKTGVTGDSLKEAQKINLSLTTLGRCIKALTSSKETHIPYRESKLTQILKESLGGNAKTVLVCTGSRKHIHQEETIGTLKFAERAKMVKNKAKSNVNRSPEELKMMVDALTEEVKKLKKRLAEGGSAGGDSIPDAPRSDPDLELKYQELLIQHETLQENSKQQIEELQVKLEQAASSAGNVDYLQMHEEKMEYEERIDEVQKKLAEVTTEKESQKLHYEQMCEELKLHQASVKNQLETSNQEKRELQSRIMEAKQSIMVCEEKIFEEQQQKERALQDLNDCNEKIRMLEERLAYMETKHQTEHLISHQNKDEQIQTLSAELERFKSEKAYLENNYESLRNRNEENERELRSQITALKKTILENDTARKTESDFFDQKLEALKLELDTVKKNDKLKEQQLKEKSEREASLMQELVEAKNKISKLETEVKLKAKENMITRKHSMVAQQMTRMRGASRLVTNVAAETKPSGVFGVQLKKTNNKFLNDAIQEAKVASQSVKDTPFKVFYGFDMIRCLYAQDEDVTKDALNRMHSRIEGKIEESSDSSSSDSEFEESKAGSELT